MPFTFTALDHGCVRCEHSGEMSLDDCRQLKAFLRAFDGHLLLNWTGTPAMDCARLLLTVRPMLPRTAICGENLPAHVFKALPGKDYYMHEVRWFTDEDEALAWLHEAAYVPRALRRVVCVSDGALV